MPNPIPNPVQACASPRLRALLLCAILFAAAPASADIPPELPPTQNLDYQAGLDAIKASDWDRAIYHLNVAATALPTDANLQNLLGYAYRQKGNYNAAFDYFLRSVFNFPTLAGLYKSAAYDILQRL